ncbi:MAG: hypothetical protein IJ836_05170 [Spirochaetales bacterium]|nr:hypothetical protein [Spirochaetales bacterium]
MEMLTSCFGMKRKKSIILEFGDGIYYSFDSDTEVKTFKWVLEGSPSTFEGLVGKTVKYYGNNDELEFAIAKGSGIIYLPVTGSSFSFDLKLGDEYVAPEDPVSYGSTYTVSINYQP